VGLERGLLSLVRTTEELLGKKSSGSGLENREYGYTHSVGSLRKNKRHSLDGEKTPTQLGPLERTNVTHWTGEKTPTQLGPSERTNVTNWTGKEDTHSVGSLRKS
jgi:hypothetical protein